MWKSEGGKKIAVVEEDGETQGRMGRGFEASEVSYCICRDFVDRLMFSFPTGIFEDI